VKDGHRASQVISGIRTMLKKGRDTKEPLDINELVRDVLTFARSEIENERIVIRTEFKENLSRVLVDRVQLQQVEFGDERYRRHGDAEGSCAGTGAAIRTSRIIQCDADGGGCWNGNRPEHYRPYIRGVFHHEKERNRHGTFDLPIHCRGPWRSAFRLAG
jgi:hypothetical protein